VEFGVGARIYFLRIKIAVENEKVVAKLSLQPAEEPGLRTLNINFTKTGERNSGKKHAWICKGRYIQINREMARGF
jgi:hypothetical protein